jgi:hypothetical protein
MEHRPFPPNATQPPQSRFPWPLIAIIVAAVMLGLIIWLIPNSNKAASSALDNTDARGNLLRLSQITLAPQDVAGTANVDVYGQATNAGSRVMNGAVVSGTFKDKNGVTIYEQQQPMERADAKSKNADVVAKSLDQEPIKPGQTIGFRVRFDQVPATWNKEPPQLTVVRVVETK